MNILRVLTNIFVFVHAALHALAQTTNTSVRSQAIKAAAASLSLIHCFNNRVWKSESKRETAGTKTSSRVAPPEESYESTASRGAQKCISFTFWFSQRSVRQPKICFHLWFYIRKTAFWPKRWTILHLNLKGSNIKVSEMKNNKNNTTY